jgi:hypothetical protein
VLVLGRFAAYLGVICARIFVSIRGLGRSDWLVGAAWWVPL